MREKTPQNFSNHVLFPTSFVLLMASFGVGALIIISGLVFASEIFGLYLIGAGALLNVISMAVLLEVVRGYVTKLQDRIIRTEMRIRLEEILPEDLQSAIATLTIKQFIALRFASDDEMPDLVRKVTSENITDLKPIKRSIRNWQADGFRV